MAANDTDPSVLLDVGYRESHSRLTTFFRYFTALPHSIVLAVWGYVVQAAAIGQWFVVVFTGRRHEGIWNFQRSWLAYASRVNSYAYLTHDVFPTFGATWGDEPVAFDHRYEADGNRLTTALRLLWIIPAYIVAIVVGIGAFVVLILVWFAILFTGRPPRGMFDFLVRALRFEMNVSAYGLLMTDHYPKYDSTTPVGVLPPGDRGAGPSRMLPPMQPGQPLPPPTM